MATETTEVLVTNYKRLYELKDKLNQLSDEVEDDSFNPSAYESTVEGVLAENDAKILRLAESVVFRLMLNAKHPTSLVNANYINFKPEGVDSNG